MNKKIEEIKSLLDEIEADLTEEMEGKQLYAFNALAIPEIISEIIDFLQPELKAYEIAIYMYLFRHSILKTGEPYIRTSHSTMYTTVLSSSGRSTALTKKTVQLTLLSLIEKGAIRKEGNATREGTLYRVFTPQEIDICQKIISEKKETVPPVIDIEKEVDFYNIKENRLKVFDRDKYRCHYCIKLLTEYSATLDHIQPISKGGDNSYHNLTTSCLHCNSERGNKAIMDHITNAKNA